jgi:hypothetical protein
VALRLFSGGPRKVRLGSDPDVPITSTPTASVATKAKPKRSVQQTSKQMNGVAGASAAPKAMTPLEERALEQLANLVNNNGETGFDLEWSNAIRKASGNQRESFELTATLRYDARSVAPGLAGSIERSAKGFSVKEAKGHAATAILAAVQEQRDGWLTAAEAARVVTTRLAATRALKPASRAEIQQFVAQHDLLRSTFSVEQQLGMVFAEASVAFPAHAGKLPRGVSLPAVTNQGGTQVRVARGAGLASSRPLAEALALKALASELQALGMGPGKDKVAGLTKSGRVVGEYEKAMHFLELISVRGPNMDDLGTMAAVQKSVAPVEQGAKGKKKGKGNKKGNGQAFGVSVKPFLDHRIVSPGAFAFDGNGATFIGTASNKKQAKHEAVVALAQGLSQRLIDAGDPESAARVELMKSLVDDAYAKGVNLATLEVPRLPMDLLNNIQDLLEENGKSATDSLAARLAEERNSELDYAARELSRRQLMADNGSKNKQRFNRREQAPPLGAEETKAWLLNDLKEQPSRTGPSMVNVRAALPINELREELKAALKTQPVVVVSGGTGSGKT